MDKKELQELDRKLDRKFRMLKVKRFAYTVLFYAAVFFGVSYLLGRLEGAALLDILAEIGICIFFSCISVVINSVIFYQLFRIDQGEKETQAFLKRRIDVKEQEEK